MDSLTRLLNELEDRANGFENLEDENFQDDLDNLEHLARRRGNSRAIAQIRAIRTNAAGYKSPSPAAQMHAGNYKTPVGAAQFDLVITRVSANIALNLPFGLFGIQAAQSAYTALVTPPTGVTLTSVLYGSNAALPTSMDFTYTQGMASDIVRISCNQVSYPEFLQGLSNVNYRLSKLRYRISAAAPTQFSTPFNVVSRSIFGKTTQNNISVSSYLAPDQFQSTVIDLPVTLDMTSESSIIGDIINTAGFQVTISCFVEAYRKD